MNLLQRWPAVCEIAGKGASLTPENLVLTLPSGQFLA
jgi:hypothetical protein